MTVNMENELTKELRKVERPRAPATCLIGTNADGSWKTSQAKDYPRDMRAGIAIAMVRAACKNQIIPTQVDADEAMEQLAAFSCQFPFTLTHSVVILFIPLTFLQICDAMVTTKYS